MTKPWIQASGINYIDILNPTVGQLRRVGVHGFAYTLGHLNRFTGWVGEYSVALHNINVSRYVRYELGRPDLARPALWHDSPEAVVGDLSTPAQMAYEAELVAAGVEPGQFQGARRRIENTIFIRMADAFDFKVPSAEDHQLIKIADLVMLRTERERFMLPIPDPEREADWLIAARALEAWPKANLSRYSPLEAAARYESEDYLLWVDDV